ncbi:MAG: hypothetical protein FJ033_13715 [Chloroflexi bacterium]|nr:hypothetical protein [Chloroflexota bacterium]
MWHDRCGAVVSNLDGCEYETCQRVPLFGALPGRFPRGRQVPQKRGGLRERVGPAARALDRGERALDLRPLLAVLGLGLVAPLVALADALQTNRQFSPPHLGFVAVLAGTLVERLHPFHRLVGQPKRGEVRGDLLFQGPQEL